MLGLIIFAAVAFIPLKVKLVINTHGLDINGRITVGVIYGRLLTLKIYNTNKKPLDFKISVFGKEFPLKKLNKTEKKLKEFTADSFAFNIKFINSLTKYINRLIICCGLGIKDRADVTAVVTGYLNGIVIPLIKISPVRKTMVRFVPVFNNDVISVKLECIFFVTPANIIHEGIRYYLKRRAYNGKHNRRRNGSYFGQTQGHG